jgi:hypothetical protein
MTEPWEAVADEFASRRRSFQAEWNRTLLRLGAPGFILFGVSLFIESAWGIVLTVVGFGLFAGALGRGALLMHRGRRCPVCDEPQRLEIEIPYRTCGRCGVRLSRGIQDST